MISLAELSDREEIRTLLIKYSAVWMSAAWKTTQRSLPNRGYGPVASGLRKAERQFWP